MSFFGSSNLFTKITPNSSNESVTPESVKGTPETVKGTPETICKYIYTDIQLVKEEIKSYNQLTNAFVHNKLYYKMFKAVEQSQATEFTAIKQRHNYSNSPGYYKELIQVYKGFLKEYDDFLGIIQCNVNNTTLRQHKTSLADLNPDDDLPDELMDPLSYQLFHDPVITPGGITYEKSIILDHFSKNGMFDPLTKEPLKQDQLYPNLAVKNSVTNYMYKNRLE